jgi:hypothetical protein
MKNVVICTSGKARPMPSPSTPAGRRGRRDDRFHRIGAADLGRNHRRNLDAGGLLDRHHGAVALATFLDLLDTDDGCADAADFADPGIIRQRFERHDPIFGALAHQFAGASMPT